ncbi:hypothetical protein BCEP4_770017 [Burkholderia cepacia]|nr:hypothetical protein BCEP4_770017 [Burkholderia cepacia]
MHCLRGRATGPVVFTPLGCPVTLARPDTCPHNRKQPTEIDPFWPLNFLDSRQSTIAEFSVNAAPHHIPLLLAGDCPNRSLREICTTQAVYKPAYLR